MPNNMGKIDRIARAITVVIIALAICAVAMPVWMEWALGIIALIFLVTAIIGTCPIYMIFKISTAGK